MRLAVVVSLLLHSAVAAQMNNLVFASLWTQHKSKYNLKLTPSEEVERRAVFLENLKHVEKVNSQNLGFKLAINEYAHMRPSELVMHTTMQRSTPLMLDQTSSADVPVKKSVDWRKHAVVTEVKNQGKCGSCYAFSAVGAIESQIAIKTGNLVNLSEQEVLDCSWWQFNLGCHGGTPDRVFKYAIRRGLSLAKDYPYVANDGWMCKRQKSMTSYRLSTYVDIPIGDEKNLVRAVSTKGPVSVAIDASHPEFMLYHSGIIRIPSCNKYKLNHAVLVVGYSVDEHESYYIVKNSWGTNWGESGYFRMSMNENMCGIATFASYPVPEV
ncbi:Cathepsin L1 [Thelohanellus kitauei]|uniref:Cathepsin L1 n=1 Tax=Thelohanellus kitauei TaxID=669202 RepID=A0A0C2JAQ8_THEKT|nr:Cathepsin L1 [Thelohanellus kitauei]